MTVAQVIPDIEKTKKIAESLLSSKIVFCQPINSGRNSRVYKIECANGEYFIGKFYYQDKNDVRDRLGVEYSSLQFLWQKGIRSIPQPRINDPKNYCAIYHYVEGKNFKDQLITEADIDQLLGFVRELQNIRGEVSVSQFLNASEACFSIQDIWNNVEYRRKRLEGADHTELKDFFKAEFDPFWVELISWAKAKALKIGVSLQEAIPIDKRVLSPSDFGFHNAIKTKDERIIFCDFEYFGWDDPIKLTSDFLLHPAMHLSDDVKEYFVHGMQMIFVDQKDLHVRLGLVYPLYGMKWCLIFLNEFLLQDFSRRLFVDHQIDKETLLKEQLGKAKNMLKKIKNTYRKNSYAN